MSWAVKFDNICYDPKSFAEMIFLDTFVRTGHIVIGAVGRKDKYVPV
jgi:hypothetical protein